MNTRERFRESGYQPAGPFDAFLPIVHVAAAIVALILILVLGAALDNAREAEDALQLLQAEVAQQQPLECTGDAP